MEDLDLDIAASRTDNDLTKELTDHIKRRPRPVGSTAESSDWVARGVSSADTKWHQPDPKLLLQPETRPISHDQLVVEVKGIYAGLVMVEAKCIDFDEKQTIAAQEKDRDPSKHRRLTPEQWQALIALHKTLLHEHHDFFLASQHPSASSALRRLATKYSMPARMRRHGIHAFLEVLRHRLPDSLDHMLAFIYIAYPLMALLYEAVPTFEDAWTECLGDLGRYLTALEEDGVRDHEIWPELPMAASRNQRVSWHRPHTTSGDTWAPYASNHKTSAATPPLYVKKVLPITINGIMVQGRHDTGAEGNFISKDDASRLGLRVRENASECQPFSMANGKLVHSIGKARAWVTFANEPETRIKCWFNVLPKLTASPIMGSKFIKVTQTLSKYKHRLQACKPITGILPSVNLIGSITLAKSRFFCLVDGRPTYVNADSASDLDLMSSAYVRAHRYRLDRRLQVCKYIQLADGTITQTIGQVTAVVKLKDGHGHKRTFDVLPGLTSSDLFGDEFLEQIDAFGSYEDSFEDILVGHRHRELSVLTSLGSVNGYLRRHSPWTTQSSVLSDTACKPN